VAALALTVSPALIERSREVSEIPLFALLAIFMVTSLVRATDENGGVGVRSLSRTRSRSGPTTSHHS